MARPRPGKPRAAAPPENPKQYAGSIKPGIACIPPIALLAEGVVMQGGAEKYGRKIKVDTCDLESEILKYCVCHNRELNSTGWQSATPIEDMRGGDYASRVIQQNTRKQSEPPVTQTELLGARRCAESATIEDSNQKIQNTPKSSGLITSLGRLEIINVFWITFAKTKSWIESKLRLEKEIFSRDWLRSVSHGKTRKESSDPKGEAAEYVERSPQDSSTSITTTKQVGYADSSAENVTRDLDSSAIISRVSKGRCATCKIRQLSYATSPDGKIEISARGSFNWNDTPIRASTYYDAIFRHLAEWYTGRDADPESRVSPLAHIRASCGILLDAAANGNLIDDRPSTADAGEEIARLTALMAEKAAKRPR